MTSAPPLHDATAECARFEAQLGAWMEQELDGPAQAFMVRHRITCGSCDALARDLEALVADAAALPSVSPSHDLWPAIEARLDTTVVSIGSAPSQVGAATRSMRTLSMRWAAVAATLLVSVTSLVTWQVARTRTAATAPDSPFPATPVRDTPAPALPPTTAAGTAADRSEVRFVADGGAPDASTTYEREISALRRIVDERFGELDSTTVAELRRNLDIIDRAIADSRAALASDPRNSVGARQLDRALEAKLDLLRRAALL